MPCPTCDHTLTNLGLDQGGRRTFWCPRCGTIKSETTEGWVDVGTPKLVPLCRRLLAEGHTPLTREAATVAVREAAGVLYPALARCED